MENSHVLKFGKEKLLKSLFISKIFCSTFAVNTGKVDEIKTVLLKTSFSTQYRCCSYLKNTCDIPMNLDVCRSWGVFKLDNSSFTL